MKHIKTALAALIILTLLSCPALAIELSPGTGDDFYVQDTANVLSSQTEAMIAEYNHALEVQCDEAQLVVVTVNYLDEDTQVASLQLLNDWGVGSESESNGMLLLLVAKEYRGWLSTGDGIDGVFTDAVVEDYLDDDFWDYIDNDEFDEGVQTLAAELYDWYLGYCGVEDSSPLSGNALAHNNYHHNDYYSPEYEQGVDFMGIVSLVIVVAVLWSIISAGRYSRMRGWGYGGGFWPIFWFGGHRMYRDWYHHHPGPRPPRGPGGFGSPGPGPGGPPGPGPGAPRSSGSCGGFGGFGGGGFGGGHGSGFGGHGGGGGGGRH